MLAVSSFYPTKKYEASNRKSSEKKRSVHRAKHLVFKQTNNIEFLQPPEPWVAEVQPYTRPHPKISLKASSIKLQKKKKKTQTQHASMCYSLATWPFAHALSRCPWVP